MLPESMTCDPRLAGSEVPTAAFVPQNSRFVQAVKVSLCMQDVRSQLGVWPCRVAQVTAVLLCHSLSGFPS